LSCDAGRRAMAGAEEMWVEASGELCVSNGEGIGQRFRYHLN